MERLTDRGIAALKPTDTSVLYFDSEVSGLAVRVYPSGKKSFVFDWREDSRQRRVVIGSPPAWTIGKARTHASRMRLKADVGEAVAPGRGERVADLIEVWKGVVAVTRRRLTAKSYSLSLDRHVIPHFGPLDPRTITRNRVEAWHGDLAQTVPVAANRALATLSAFMSWLEHDHRIERNICKGVKRRPENQRHVFLDEAETEAAHAALDADSARAAALALRLALLTGARIGEVLSLTADQIDASRRVWIKPHTLTKQKKISIVPLQPEALAVAEALLAIGLPEYKTCTRVWARTRAVIGRPDIRIHDLRHSRASALARNGASLPQIGKLLGHASHQTTARYLHLIDADLRDLVERTS
jgi:integrase